MSKSLGDYNIEKSSSSDLKNIQWIQKNSIDSGKTKNKKKKPRNTTSLNIIYSKKTKKIKPDVEKFFKVDETIKSDKSKNKKKLADKKFQNSSASNCKIEQGFKRPGR